MDQLCSLGWPLLHHMLHWSVHESPSPRRCSSSLPGRGIPGWSLCPESSLQALLSGLTFLFIDRTERPAPKPGSSVSLCGSLSSSGPLSAPASSLWKWPSWSLASHGCCEDGLGKDMPTRGVPLSRPTPVQGWAHSRDSGTVWCSDFF